MALSPINLTLRRLSRLRAYDGDRHVEGGRYYNVRIQYMRKGVIRVTNTNYLIDENNEPQNVEGASWDFKQFGEAHEAFKQLCDELGIQKFREVLK